MKQLFIGVFIFSSLFCGAQDTLYKVNSKPFLNQKTFLYTPEVKKKKEAIRKPIENMADQNFWKLTVVHQNFVYSNKQVKPFGTTLLIDNFSKSYEPLNFNFTGPIGTNPNYNYLSGFVYNILVETKTIIQHKRR